MTEDPRVVARATDVPGRFLVSARSVHVVGDASGARGGSGEALVAAEFMLASLATCGLAIVTDVAGKRGSTPTSTSVETTYTVDPEDTTRFRRVAMARTTPTEVWGEAA